MKKRMKTKWIKVLRSGKFIQGQKFLRRRQRDGSFKHCCLGVLRDLYPEKITKKGCAGGAFKTETLMDIGLTSGNMAQLIRMNDGDSFTATPRHNFHEIAKWIENQVEVD